MNMREFSMLINNLKGVDTATTSKNDEEFIVHLNGEAFKVTMEKVETTGDIIKDLENNVR